MTGTNCDLFTYNQSRSYLNHLVHRSSCKIPVIHIVTKLESSLQIFEKYSNIKCHDLSSGSQAVPCTQMDRHDEANSYFLRCCEYA
jgi:hypothetical protein